MYPSSSGRGRGGREQQQHSSSAGRVIWSSASSSSSTAGKQHPPSCASRSSKLLDEEEDHEKDEEEDNNNEGEEDDGEEGDGDDHHPSFSSSSFRTLTTRRQRKPKKSLPTVIDLVNDNRALSLEFQNNNIEKSTKEQYENKIKHFFEWTEKNFPHCLNKANDCVDFEKLTKDGLGDFLAHVSKRKDKQGNYVNPLKFYSPSHVNGYVSAVKYYYKLLHGEKLPPDMDEVCVRSLNGFVRRIEALKTSGEIAMHEGKMPMSFEGYRYIAKNTIRADHDFPLFVFAHVFLILCWNLIARCVSVASLTFYNISWEEDCLTIVFPTHKGDKEGKNASPKHVYANPQKPYICPVLSLAIYIWCSGNKIPGSTPVVFSTDVDPTEERFSSWLRNFCIKHGAQLVEMGMAIAEIGTHSFRKGIASFISGLPGGPSPIAIYLRAGWSLGKVVSRYILEGFGGDQLCGRAATGLSLTDLNFGMLPPHFDNESGPVLTKEEWELYVNGYSTFYPEKFRRVFPYLLASLCYHYEYLDSTLHSNHPLRLQPIWTSGILQRLKPRLLGGSIEAPSRIEATGVPPHIIIAKNLLETNLYIQRLETSLLDRLKALPAEVREEIVNAVTINGVQHMTEEKFESMLAKLEAKIMNAVEGIQSSNRSHNDIASVPGDNEDFDPSDLLTNQLENYEFSTWNGRLHCVPEGFKLAG